MVDRLTQAWTGWVARLALVALLFAVLAPAPSVQAGGHPDVSVAQDHDHHAQQHGDHEHPASAAADLQCHCPVVGCVPAMPTAILVVAPAFVAASRPLPPSDTGLPLASVIPPHKPPRA